jgi:phytoene dehydrogenase-like protein
MTSIVKRSTTPGRHVYDVIVVGGQLAGALTTALLARQGVQTLLAPHDGLSAPYLCGEWRLPHAPFVLPPIRTLPVLEEQLSALGLTSTAQRLLKAPPLQVLEPRSRFERAPDEAARAKEFSRAFGEDADAAETAWRQAVDAAAASEPFFAARPELPPQGFVASWRFKRLVSRIGGLDADTPLPESSPLRRLLPWAAPVEAAGRLTRARALGHLLAGPTVVAGGREGLLALLHERARELGADVLPPSEAVDALVFDGKVASGVRLGRGETVYRAPMVVAACDLDVLAPLLPDARRAAADPLLLRVESRRCLFTLNVVLPERALPRGLGELAVVRHDAFDGGLALLQVSAARTAADSEAADLRLLTVSVPAPLRLGTDGEPAIRGFIDSLWAALEDVLPFTRRHVVLESTPWLHAPGVTAGRGEPTPLCALPQDSRLGVSALTTGTPWKRLVLASRQVLPGLGVEGEALAAARAVRLIEATLKKNDPLKAKRPA